MKQKHVLDELPLASLEQASGGADWGTAKKVGKAVLKKAGPVGLAITAYDGISAGYDSYQKGNGWGTIAKDAAWGAAW